MKKLFSILSFLTIIYAWGQSGGINSQLSELFPQTPNAAGMTQYGKLSIGEFTGTMQHSIDVYEINYKDLKVPITLSYSSNGVNIDKFETIVGIDWSLNWGGVISRIIMDDPDESCPVNFPEPPYEPSNPLLLSIISSDCADIQPDIYNFNVLGYQGKFYIKNPNSIYAEAVMIDPTPVKVENLGSGTGEIKLILPNGMICSFGGNLGIDLTASRSHHIGSAPSPPTTPVNTSFYLSRIESPNGGIIEFNYENIYFNRYVGISQTVKAKKIDGIFIGAQYDSESAPITNRSFGEESRISSIEWENNKIDFIYNDELLDRIEIKHKNAVIQDNRFEYYQTSANSIFQNPDCSYCGENTVRKFLKKIVRKSLLNSDDEIHEFIYYNLENLPPRLSYARDYWGYFNGKQNAYLVPNDVSKYNPNDYFSEPSAFFNYNDIQSLFSQVGGDRNTDPSYALNGMLKKIIYPTKGETEILYEANSYSGEISIPGELAYHTLIVETDDNLEAPLPVIDIATTLPLPSDQWISLAGEGFFNIYECSDSPHLNLGEFRHRTEMTVSNAVTNESVDLYTYSNITNEYISLETNNHIFRQGEDAPASIVYINGQEGESYKVVAQVGRHCTRGSVHFSYYSTEPTIYQENIPYGGMRVQSIINRTEDGIATKEDYFYGDIDSLESSNAVFETLKPAISFFSSANNIPASPYTAVSVLGSSSMNSLYFSGSTPIAYPNVSKKISSENGYNGMVMRNYNVTFDALPIILEGDWIPGTPYTNVFGNGDILKELIFSENSPDPIHEKIYHYIFDNNFDDSIEGHNISTSHQIQIAHPHAPSQIITHFNINKYKVNTKRLYMDYIIEREFTPNGTLEKRTDFMYDGTNKLLKSSESFTNSDGKIHVTEYRYPSDLIGLEQTPSMQELTDANRISDPVITKNFVKHGVFTEKTSETHIKYGKNASTGNLLLPVEVHSNIGNADININNIEHRKIIYTKYGTNGNILEYELENGTPVSIIWGYDEQYPIAKVEGENYANLSSYITTLQSASDNGTLTVASFDTLRNGLLGAMVTGYVYEPLVGIKVITHPNGTTEYYDYDAFGRLIEVKNSQGEVIRKMEYNYKPQL